VKRVLDRLERSGWINDALFSRDWARGRVEGRGWGRERVRHELRQKGVAGETVETTIRDLYADQDEAVMAMDHLSRRFRPGSVLSLRDRRRAVGMLLRRGFGLETVEAALQKFEQKDGNHDVR
jgi:regulatory protein